VNDNGASIEDEVRAALRELLDETRATSARIVAEDDARTGVPARTLALGGGEFLRVELPTRARRDMDAESGAIEVDVETALANATHKLRAIRRRWDAAKLPELAVAGGALPPSVKVVERIEAYLQGLASIDRATNAFVTKGTQLVASARPPGELETSRWPFLARRALATHAPGSSHGEVIDPDAFAMSFYYDAALVVLLAEPYGLDFVRHRCKSVARELCNLLPLLDPEPAAPAAMRPRRPTQQ
jgi:hypothetical protein